MTEVKAHPKLLIVQNSKKPVAYKNLSIRYSYIAHGYKSKSAVDTVSGDPGRRGVPSVGSPNSTGSDTISEKPPLSRQKRVKCADMQPRVPRNSRIMNYFNPNIMKLENFKSALNENRTRCQDTLRTLHGRYTR